MTIRFTCPGCGRSIEVPDEKAGKVGRCAGCRERVTVPATDGFNTLDCITEYPETAEDDEGEDEEPSGFGGWLVVPMLNLTFGALMQVAWLFLSVSFLPTELSGSLLYWGIVGLSSIRLLFTIVVAVLFFRRRRVLIPAIVAWYGGSVVIAAIQGALLFLLIGGWDDEIAKSLIGSLIPAAIWIPYFLKSRRVRNTFVN